MFLNSYLSVSRPAHPIVYEHGIGANFVSDEDKLKCVCLIMNNEVNEYENKFHQYKFYTLR